MGVSGWALMGGRRRERENRGVVGEERHGFNMEACEGIDVPASLQAEREGARKHTALHCGCLVTFQKHFGDHL